MLKASITVDQNADALAELFKFEEKSFQNGRSSYKVRESKGALIFEIEAADSTALRSTINTITKILTVYEKTKGVSDGQAN